MSTLVALKYARIAVLGTTHGIPVDHGQLGTVLAHASLLCEAILVAYNFRVLSLLVPYTCVGPDLRLFDDAYCFGWDLLLVAGDMVK